MERGLASYYDSEGVAWHYTPRGAVLVVREFFRQLGGALTQFWRVKRPTAGTALLPPGSNLMPVQLPIKAERA